MRNNHLMYWVFVTLYPLTTLATMNHKSTNNSFFKYHFHYLIKNRHKQKLKKITMATISSLIIGSIGYFVAIKTYKSCSKKNNDHDHVTPQEHTPTHAICNATLDLQDALNQNNIHGIRQAISQGANATALYVDGNKNCFPLITLAKSDQALRSLVSNGQDRSILEQKIPIFNLTPLMYFLAVRSKKKYSNLVKTLVDLGADVNNTHNGYTPLLYAAWFSPHLFAFLVSKGAELHISSGGWSLAQWIQGGKIATNFFTELEQSYSEYPKTKPIITAWLQQNSIKNIMDNLSKETR